METRIKIIPKEELKELKERQKIRRRMDIVSDIRSRIPRRTLLEEVTVYDIPVYMHESDIVDSSQFRDTIIIGMRKKYNIVQKQIKNCNLETLRDICELGELMDIHDKELRGIPSFESLLRDYKDIQKDFIKGCTKQK